MSSSGRLSPGRMAAKHGDATATMGWGWLEEEEQKLHDTLKQCNREAEREWSRIQRSHPELKKIPMPTLGGSSHDRMWHEVKWMLKRKVEEQEARAKRMAMRIQRLEADAEQADSRRADLERAMGSLANSREKEMEGTNNKVEALSREKEVLLDELDRRCTEIEQMQAQLDEVKKTEETTTWAFKTAVASNENNTAELKKELKDTKEALAEQQVRVKEAEREHDRDKVESEVKIGMLESQVEETRQLSTDFEREVDKLRAEVQSARQGVEEEKRRSAQALHDMQMKLSVWSEEGSLAIQEAQHVAKSAENRAREREKEVERNAKGSLLSLEVRAQEELERFKKEAEKERRAEREDLLRKAGSLCRVWVAQQVSF